MIREKGRVPNQWAPGLHYSVLFKIHLPFRIPFHHVRLEVGHGEQNNFLDGFHLVPVNDLPVREIGQRGRQDIFDQQGKSLQ